MMNEEKKVKRKEKGSHLLVAADGASVGFAESGNRWDELRESGTSL